jgi:hypothetical protein
MRGYQLSWIPSQNRILSVSFGCLEVQGIHHPVGERPEASQQDKQEKVGQKDQKPRGEALEAEGLSLGIIEERGAVEAPEDNELTVKT